MGGADQDVAICDVPSIVCPSIVTANRAEYIACPRRMYVEWPVTVACSSVPLRSSRTWATASPQRTGATARSRTPTRVQLALDVEDSSTSVGANVWLNTASGSPSEQWQLVPQDGAEPPSSRIFI